MNKWPAGRIYDHVRPSERQVVADLPIVAQVQEGVLLRKSKLGLPSASCRGSGVVGKTAQLPYRMSRRERQEDIGCALVVQLTPAFSVCLPIA